MIRIELSRPDAESLLRLLETSTTFPDVVEELRAALAQPCRFCGKVGHGLMDCPDKPAAWIGKD